MAILSELFVPLGDLARTCFGGDGSVRSVRVAEGDDADGDPALFVTVVLESSELLRQPSKLLAYKLRARDLLEAHGEGRFPVFSFVLASEDDRYAAA